MIHSIRMLKMRNGKAKLCLANRRRRRTVIVWNTHYAELHTHIQLTHSCCSLLRWMNGQHWKQTTVWMWCCVGGGDSRKPYKCTRQIHMPCRNSVVTATRAPDVVCLSGIAWGWNELETYVLHIFRIVCIVFNNTPSNADASHSHAHSTGADPAWLHDKSFSSLQFAKESHRVWMCDQFRFPIPFTTCSFQLKFVISLFIFVFECVDYLYVCHSFNRLFEYLNCL